MYSSLNFINYRFIANLISSLPPPSVFKIILIYLYWTVKPNHPKPAPFSSINPFGKAKNSRKILSFLPRF